MNNNKNNNLFAGLYNDDLQIELEPTLSISPGEIIIGYIVKLDMQNQPLVDFHGNIGEKPIVAVSTLAITNKHINKQAALLFASGDITKPVIMGLIHNPLHDMIENYQEPNTVKNDISNPVRNSVSDYETVIDGNRILIEGKEEIVLKCGEASITLTKAGKILIRGKYISNRASGVNRIMGGSVQVN